MIERLCLSDFEPLVGSPFTLRVGEESVELTLVEASGLGEAGRDAGRAPFSLLYRGPMGFLVEQRIYRLEHASLGPMDLFMVPIQPDDQGSLYEVVFT